MPVYPFSELQKTAKGKLFIAANLTFPPELFSTNTAYVNISIDFASKLKRAEDTKKVIMFLLPSRFCPQADEQCMNTVEFIIYQ